VRIRYGGSVDTANERAILSLPGMGGALVGGASLEADDFEGMFNAIAVSEHR
jgi:triosephosphate isomerase